MNKEDYEKYCRETEERSAYIYKIQQENWAWFHRFKMLNEEINVIKNEKPTEDPNELLRHQLNRLRCFLWMNMPTYSCSKRKISNIDIWDYFNKKDPKKITR